MADKRKINKRILVDEKFDELEPMAKAIRSLLPADSSMDPEARERMMGHLFSVQRGLRRDAGTRRVPMARHVLIPAVAVVLVAAVLGAVLLPMFFGGSSKKRVTIPQIARFGDLVGGVRVLEPGRSWRAATAGDRIGAGWSVRTESGSLASIRFPEGSIARVTDGSQAKIVTVAADEVAIEHVSGGTYHRVHKGTKYTVINGDVSSHALGTAFNVENRMPGHLEILTVESAVEVSIGSHEPIKVSQGEVMTVSMSQDKKAEKQPVSRERLQDSRLMASVQQDAEAGYSTGVYKNLDVPTSPQREVPQTAPSQSPSIQMAGDVADLVATLSWNLVGPVEYGELVLLRSEGVEPTYPANEIARYSDTSMSSATDNTIQRGRTYQYRVAGIPAGSGEVVYSNTVVVDVPALKQPPGPVSVSLSVKPSVNGVSAEWSVSGATRFSGFVVERVVEKAPDGSQTPTGSTNFRRIKSSDVFYSYLDETVMPGHTYSYRVGLVVGGAVMMYSDWKVAEVARR